DARGVAVRHAAPPQLAHRGPECTTRLRLLFVSESSDTSAARHPWRAPLRGAAADLQDGRMDVRFEVDKRKTTYREYSAVNFRKLLNARVNHRRFRISTAPCSCSINGWGALRGPASRVATR